MDYMSELVEALDTYLGLGWTTELKESDDKGSWIFTVNGVSNVSGGCANPFCSLR